MLCSSWVSSPLFSQVCGVPTGWYTNVISLFTIFWILWSKMKITQADTPTIQMDCYPILTNWCPNLWNPHHFYAGCPSWHNPPNLSWLETGTKYAGLHTRWLGKYRGGKFRNNQITTFCPGEWPMLVCMFCLYFVSHFCSRQCFDAVGWASGRTSNLKKNWLVGCWHCYLSGARCRFAYGPADATATHCFLLQIGLPFWQQLTWVVLDKGPLNGCCSLVFFWLPWNQFVWWILVQTYCHYWIFVFLNADHRFVNPFIVWCCVCGI